MDTTETISLPHEAQPHATWKSIRPYFRIWLAMGILPAIIHLGAVGLVDTPGQNPITWTQGICAALANTAGPWGSHVARLVNFPNAGLRDFNLVIAIGLTALAIAIMRIGVRATRKRYAYTGYSVFGVLMAGWYGYGFFLIAAGLL